MVPLSNPEENEELPLKARQLIDRMHAQTKIKWEAGYDDTARVVMVRWGVPLTQLFLSPEQSEALGLRLLANAYLARRVKPVICGGCKGRGLL